MLGLIAFAVLFEVFMRLPTEMPYAMRRGIRFMGVLIALLLIVCVNLTDGDRPFSWARNDIILVLLAWASIIASLLWIVTKNRPVVRMAIGLSIAWFAH